MLIVTHQNDRHQLILDGLMYQSYDSEHWLHVFKTKTGSDTAALPVPQCTNIRLAAISRRLAAIRAKKERKQCAE
ncbi:hypothetical protein EB966_25080 [Salmonella enterica]|nr:hypothetical protein [Salmonella enterica]MLG27066.1 hypothetical protein [Salmonella enterica]